MGNWFMFNIFPLLFGIVFLFIFGTFIGIVVSVIRKQVKNNNSPRLTVEARVVSRRTEISHHRNANTHTAHSSTHYYATFEFESGDRLELPLSGEEYGMLAEGDSGKLSFQGTRYLGFDRS